MTFLARRYVTDAATEKLKTRLRQKLMDVVTANSAKRANLVASHILKGDMFPTVRLLTAENTVKAFINQRGKQGHNEEKTENPLIGVAGSPGSGKTEFSKHLPVYLVNLSAEAKLEASTIESAVLSDDTTQAPKKKQFRKLTTDGLLPHNTIVCVFTFNSEMDGDPLSLGLRIAYGSLRSSGSTETWNHFIADLLQSVKEDPSMMESSLSLSQSNQEDVRQAIKLIRDVRGQGADCPVLIIVDEFSKARKYLSDRLPELELVAKEKSLMHALGDAMDRDPNTHVIATSLSPQFIKVLVTGSQRTIKYVPLPIDPLLEHPLGLDTCSTWVQELMEKNDWKAKEIDWMHQRVMEHMALVLSVHPRSVERLVEYLQTPDSHEGDLATMFLSFLEDVEEQKRNHGSNKRKDILQVPHLLRVLANRLADIESLEDFHCNLDDITLGIVLDNKPWSPSAKGPSAEGVLATMIRGHVEAGTLRIVCNDKGQFRTMASLVQLRHLIFPRLPGDVSESGSQKGLRSTAFAKLTRGDSEYFKKLTVLCKRLFSRVHLLGDLFESCVAMTVVSNSHRGITSKRVFGLSEDGGRMGISSFPTLSVRLASEPSDMKWNHHRSNELVMAPACHPAYDARVVVGKKVFYLQMKVLARKTMTKLVRDGVTALMKLLESEDVPKTVALHYVWYVHTEKSVSLKEQDKLKLLSRIKEMGYHVELHIVSAGALDEWMIPSFGVIPWLIRAVRTRSAVNTKKKR